MSCSLFIQIFIQVNGSWLFQLFITIRWIFICMSLYWFNVFCLHFNFTILYTGWTPVISPLFKLGGALILLLYTCQCTCPILYTGKWILIYLTFPFYTSWIFVLSPLFYTRWSSSPDFTHVQSACTILYTGRCILITIIYTGRWLLISLIYTGSWFQSFLYK